MTFLWVSALKKCFRFLLLPVYLLLIFRFELSSLFIYFFIYLFIYLFLPFCFRMITFKLSPFSDKFDSIFYFCIMFAFNSKVSIVASTGRLCRFPVLLVQQTMIKIIHFLVIVLNLTLVGWCVHITIRFNY